MKKQILEVQNYFTNKITACEFDSFKVEFKNSGWVHLETTIDGFEIKFSIHIEMKIYCSHGGDFNIQISNDRLSNLIELVESKKEEARLEKIESLKAELEKLQTA